MKTSVRYFSRSGNTEKIAKAIADGAKAEIFSITDEPHLNERTDTLFLGGAPYADIMAAELRKYAENLSPDMVGKVVLFTTSNWSRRTVYALRKILTEKGIKVEKEYFYAHMLNISGRLDAAEEFGRKYAELKGGYFMNIYDFKVRDNKGNEVSLSEYKGKVLLIVNTATKCGLTPQYEELEALYEKYHDKGFEILDFPCNQFAFQAPGSAEKIDSFCTLRYNTKFPRFAKIKVNGKDAEPLYVYLKDRKPGDIQWNFAKFLISKNGRVVGRFAPAVKPVDIGAAIENELKKQIKKA